MNSNLRHAAERVAYEPGFLANDLRVFTEVQGSTRADAASLLGMYPDRFDELALCRTPSRGERFAGEVRSIADYAGADARALANLLRLVDALLTLASAPNSDVAPVLAAARETALTIAPQQPKGQGLQPAWLKDAVELLGRHGDAAFPRDIELAVLWCLPLAIIELDDLSGISISAWLSARDVNLPVHSPPHGLHGALVAFGGSGVLFLNAGDPPAERRLTVAHEAAHFLVDYWLPRGKVAARAPALLEVADGVRGASPVDHVDSLLARVPFGLHTHLFERDPAGAIPNLGVNEAEQRATQVAWELLAPQAAVAARVFTDDEFSLVRTLESEFGLPRESAREYGKYLRRALKRRRGREPFDWS
ncbi:MAG: hypothetical protein QOE69_1837 [Thermoleophilaceae bacterium]|jgi:hypothetical protein|nr:hypothetical protein [Thermoleophilaceae bacterium]